MNYMTQQTPKTSKDPAPTDAFPAQITEIYDDFGYLFSIELGNNQPNNENNSENNSQSIQ